MTETTPPAVLTELRDHVLVVTLNRPEARNAVNAALTQGLGDALERADGDAEIRAVVLTGAGDKSFCAGADLKAISRGESLNPPGTEQWGFAGFVNHPISKPVIAAVNATALGGGTELVLASDLVVAGESAKFGLPEVRRGLMAAAGGLIRLPEQLPRKVAMHLILTGEPMDAETALRWGLVNEVVPDRMVLDAAIDLAEVVAANAPLSVQASKRIALGLYANSDLAHEREAWQANNDEMIALMSSEDAIEGPTAFAEKREPSGRRGDHDERARRCRRRRGRALRRRRGVPPADRVPRPHLRGARGARGDGRHLGPVPLPGRPVRLRHVHPRLRVQAVAVREGDRGRRRRSCATSTRPRRSSGSTQHIRYRTKVVGADWSTAARTLDAQPRDGRPGRAR